MKKTRLPLAAAAALALTMMPSCSDAVAAASHSLAFDKNPVGLEDTPMPKHADYTEAKAALGMKLFFDKRLSSNDSTSCETCHVHEKGWTDGIRFSTKVNGKKNTRNSPTLYNVGYHSKMYWDGRAPNMEANIGAAWKGHMGGSADVVAKINEIEGYKTEFQSAFGADASEKNIPQALAHFVRTLRAGDSAYDRDEMDDAAKAGKALFIGKAGCVVCHVLPLFTDMTFHNTGAGESADPGRGKIDKKLPGAFKTPTLRNVAKSGPYFHDGSVASLEEAVRFMVDGGKANANLDPLLTKKELTDEEIGQLVAFLNALSSNEKFEKPTLPK
jgi:cytochrome c peroxidase